MNTKDLEKRVAGYRSYVNACDESGLPVSEYARQNGKKRQHYYNCKKNIEHFEAKMQSQTDPTVMPPSDIRLPILELHGNNFSLVAYDGFDPTVAITLLAFAMQHDVASSQVASDDCEGVYPCNQT